MRLPKFLILLALLLLSSTAFAQTEGELALFGAGEQVAYVVYQQATDGQITRNEDGTVTVALSGVPSEILLIQTTPPSTIAYQTADLAKDWATMLASVPEDALVNPYEAEAELRFAEGVLFVTIVNVAFDEATQNLLYTILINQFLPKLTGTDFDMSLASGESKIPSALGAVQVVLSGKNAFWNALQASTDTGLGAIRTGEGGQCDEAYQALAEANASLQTLLRAAETAFNEGRYSDYMALLTEIRTVRTSINYVNTWIQANCR